MIAMEDIRNTEDQDETGRMVVRRFTGMLVGETELERETIAAQEQQDEHETTIARTRMTRFYDDRASHPTVFDGAQAARNALKESFEKCLAETKAARKESLLGFPRSSSKQKVDDKLREYIDAGFEGVTTMVTNLDNDWKKSHSKAYNNFQGLCETVNSHKAVFALFPSQSLYGSVLCGSFTLLINAAANHNEIAETISQTIRDISRKAANCAEILDIINTDRMRKRLADVYSELFFFLRDVLAWFVQSRRARFFKSFDDKVKKKFEESGKAIQDRIDEMWKESGKSQMAIIWDARDDIQEARKENRHLGSAIGAELRDIKAELFRQRQEPKFDVRDLGNLMLETLLSQHQEITFRCTLRRSHDGARPENLEIEYENKPLEIAKSSTVPRGQALAYTYHLEEFIVGDDGLRYLSDARHRLAEDVVMRKLQEWITATENSRTLWISCPVELQMASSARAASLGVIAAALQVEAPFISHFCEKPRYGSDTSHASPERVALIGMVYDLVYQLLQFNIEDTNLDLSQERMQRLDGTDQSWRHSISLLDDLLKHTLNLPYCVIHGMNILEVLDGTEWCHDLVEVLVGHQQKSDNVFNLLFTTAGQSRVLDEWISRDDRFYATKTMKYVQRRGQQLNLRVPQAL